MSNEMSNVLRRRSPATSAALAQDVWRVEMRGAVGAGYQQPGQRGRAAARLGTELRRLRLALGISQRRVTQLIRLSAHSNLGDYERRRPSPPFDLPPPRAPPPPPHPHYSHPPPPPTHLHP